MKDKFNNDSLEDGLNEEIFEEDDISELTEIDENEVFDVPETNEPVKPFLALCEKCNEPLYKKQDIHRIETKNGSRILCRNCYNKAIANAKQAKANKIARIEQQQKMVLQEKSKKAKARLIHSIIWPLIFSIIWFIVAFTDKSVLVPGLILGVLSFAWLACLILKDNLVTNWYAGLWDGLVDDHIGMNIILWLLGWFAIVFFIMALYTALSFILAPFVYPFALAKKIKIINQGKEE